MFRYADPFYRSPVVKYTFHIIHQPFYYSKHFLVYTLLVWEPKYIVLRVHSQFLTRMLSQNFEKLGKIFPERKKLYFRR